MKRNLLKELDPGGESVRELALSRSDAELLCAVAGERGHSATIADLTGCYDRAGLLACVVEALEFPEPFVGNWEALFDCLVDLSWLPADGHLLVLLNTAELRRDAPEAFDTALSIIREAALQRQKRGGSLRTIIDVPPAPKRSARKRRRGNGKTRR